MKKLQHTGCRIDINGMRAELWQNDIYACAAYKDEISIQRHDGKPVHSWRDFQAIKNQLAGEEAEAIEIYPAVSRLVDMTNTYHLWLAPTGKGFDFGFRSERMNAMMPEHPCPRPY